MAVIYNNGVVNIINVGSAPVKHLIYNNVEVPFGPKPTELELALTANDLTQTIYYTQSAANAVTVDWGDNTTPSTSADLTASVSHTWAVPGTYTVTLTVAEGETAGIGDGTAYGIPALVRAFVGERVTSLSNSAFRNCGILTSAVLSNAVQNIGNAAFAACSALESIVLPDSVQSFGMNVFAGCQSLREVKVPDGATEIGNMTFMSCGRLTSVTIPASVTKIFGIQPFGGCTSLSRLTILNPTPITVATGAFSSVPADMAIYVPAGSVAAYQAASDWSDRAAYIQAIP